MVKTVLDIWTKIYGSHEALSLSSNELQSNVDSSRIRFSLPEEQMIESASPWCKVPSTHSKKEKNKLMKILCVVILDDCIGQLLILSSVFKPVVGKVERREIVYRPLEERFRFDEPIDFNKFIIDAEYTNYHKFGKDVRTLIHLLQDARDEVYVFGALDTLNNYIEAATQMEIDEVEFLEQVHKKEKIYNDLNKIYKNLKSDHAKKCKEIDRTTCAIFSTAKDDMEYAYAEVAFVKKWEGARMEQNSMVLRRNEHSFRSTITNMENEMNLETRVHDQLKKYLTEAEQDYYNEIERWMEVYDREFEDREMDIYQLKHRTDMLLDKKENLQTKYDERAQEMKDWIEYKRRKKEQEERLALETWATVKIQAWWRGVMFRKKLGPYRKKKKKGKGKGKDKNKGANKGRRRK